MEISFHYHLNFDTVITAKFCTWHDSSAKICCDRMASNWIAVRERMHRIGIVGKKSLVKRAQMVMVIQLKYGYKTKNYGEIFCCIMSWHYRICIITDGNITWNMILNTMIMSKRYESISNVWNAYSIFNFYQSCYRGPNLVQKWILAIGLMIILCLWCFV